MPILDIDEPIKKIIIKTFLPCEFDFILILFLAVGGGSLPRGCKFACMIHFHLLLSRFCYFILVKDVFSSGLQQLKRGAERAAFQIQSRR